MHFRHARLSCVPLTNDSGAVRRTGERSTIDKLPATVAVGNYERLIPAVHLSCRLPGAQRIRGGAQEGHPLPIGGYCNVAAGGASDSHIDPRAKRRVISK